MLAIKMNVEPMTLVGFLDRLEAQDLISRQVDPGDRRAKIIHLTAKAPPLVTRILEAGRQMRLEVLGDIAPAEQATFITCLLRMNAALSGCERES